MYLVLIVVKFTYTTDEFKARMSNYVPEFYLN